MIELELFTQVQERRKEKSRELGRVMQPNSFGNRSMFAGSLICGVCGQPYRRYVEHCGQPGEKIVWKCKHYINENKGVLPEHIPGRQPDHPSIYGTDERGEEWEVPNRAGNHRAGPAI